MSRDIRQLCREITHCPRYQRKWLPEETPGAIFMPDGHVFGHISKVY
jgi:hypothetical protein